MKGSNSCLPYICVASTFLTNPSPQPQIPFSSKPKQFGCPWQSLTSPGTHASALYHREASASNCPTSIPGQHLCRQDWEFGSHALLLILFRSRENRRSPSLAKAQLSGLQAYPQDSFWSNWELWERSAIWWGLGGSGRKPYLVWEKKKGHFS